MGFRWVKRGLIQALFSQDGDLPTSPGDIDWNWKEHSEKLLNSEDTPSVRQGWRTQGSHCHSLSISLAEVAEVVKKFLRSKVFGVDDISLKILDAAICG